MLIVSSKGFNSYISVADDVVSPLYLSTLLFCYIHMNISHLEKSASWQLVADVRAPKIDAKRQKTTQKCQNWLKIKWKICSEILVAVVFRIFYRYDIYIYVYDKPVGYVKNIDLTEWRASWLREEHWWLPAPATPSQAWPTTNSIIPGATKLLLEHRRWKCRAHNGV